MTSFLEATSPTAAAILKHAGLGTPPTRGSGSAIGDQRSAMLPIPSPITAISLHQPWASLMAAGIKTNETRNRLTHYRGWLAIQAAVHKPTLGEMHPKLMKLLWDNRGLMPGVDLDNEQAILNQLPYGMIVALVEVYDCQLTNRFQITEDPRPRFCITDAEHTAGDYSPGRWVWRTRNCLRLKLPVPVKGYQGFFKLPQHVEASVRHNLNP